MTEIGSMGDGSGTSGILDRLFDVLLDMLLIETVLARLINDFFDVVSCSTRIVSLGRAGISGSGSAFRVCPPSKCEAFESPLRRVFFSSGGGGTYAILDFRGGRATGSTTVDDACDCREGDRKDRWPNERALCRVAISSQPGSESLLS